MADSLSVSMFASVCGINAEFADSAMSFSLSKPCYAIGRSAHSVKKRCFFSADKKIKNNWVIKTEKHFII